MAKSRKTQACRKMSLGTGETDLISVGHGADGAKIPQYKTVRDSEQSQGDKEQVLEARHRVKRWTGQKGESNIVRTA